MAGILDDQLPNSILGNRGEALPANPGANPNSTLHLASSVNNNPAINLPNSNLSLNGEAPSEVYLDNLPR